jgi:hypothetical protein
MCVCVNAKGYLRLRVNLLYHTFGVYNKVMAQLCEI